MIDVFSDFSVALLLFAIVFINNVISVYVRWYKKQKHMVLRQQKDEIQEIIKDLYTNERNDVPVKMWLPEQHMPKQEQEILYDENDLVKPINIVKKKIFGVERFI